MLIADNHFPVGIHQIESQPAELGTLSTVRTAAVTGLTGVTLTAVAHTQGSMNKNFERRVGTIPVNRRNLFQCQFACEHHLTETGLSQKLHFLRRTVIHLRTGMQRNGRKLQTGNPHILHDQCIHTGTVQIPDHGFRVLKFVVFQNRIDGNINTRIVKMCIVHQGGNIFQRISSCRTGTETGSTDVNGIRSMINGFHAALQVPGWSQQFDRTLSDHSLISLIS